MEFNELEKKMLMMAKNAYPAFAILEPEGLGFSGLSEYSYEDVGIAIKNLQNSGFLKDAIRVSVDQQITITGNLELTVSGYKRAIKL